MKRVPPECVVRIAARRLCDNFMITVISGEPKDEDPGAIFLFKETEASTRHCEPQE
jgi:hypothetical protein